MSGVCEGVVWKCVPDQNTSDIKVGMLAFALVLLSLTQFIAVADASTLGFCAYGPNRCGFSMLIAFCSIAFFAISVVLAACVNLRKSCVAKIPLAFRTFCCAPSCLLLNSFAWTCVNFFSFVSTASGLSRCAKFVCPDYSAGLVGVLASFGSSIIWLVVTATAIRYWSHARNLRAQDQADKQNVEGEQLTGAGATGNAAVSAAADEPARRHLPQLPPSASDLHSVDNGATEVRTSEEAEVGGVRLHIGDAGPAASPKQMDASDSGEEEHMVEVTL